jgi:hypothetical protein
VELVEKRGQDYPVRHRPGDVGDDHSGLAFAAGKFAQRRGADWATQGFPHRVFRIGEGRVATRLGDDHLDARR